MTRRSMRLAVSLLAMIVVDTGVDAGNFAEGDAVETLTIRHGQLSVTLRDNSRSPKVLSGVQSLFNAVDAPTFDAYDPDSPGASAGLNFEHIISGHADAANKFTPRKGPYSLHPRPGHRAAELVRRAEDGPWRVASTFRYTVREPHYVDFEFRCAPRDAGRFGQRGYAVFFFANYMNDVDDFALHFRGVGRKGESEEWIRAEAPPGHKDYNGGGTYRHVDAPALAYDENHNFKLNLWSYDSPCFTAPFYYGRAAHGMCLMLMFDRAYSTQDEIRFSLFKFKLPERPRPAWDWQYVIHRVEEGREYGFRGRLVWKKFIGPDDCLAEYEGWRKSLAQPKR